MPPQRHGNREQKMNDKVASMTLQDLLNVVDTRFDRLRERDEFGYDSNLGPGGGIGYKWSYDQGVKALHPRLYFGYNPLNPTAPRSPDFIITEKQRTSLRQARKKKKSRKTKRGRHNYKL